MRRRDLVHRSMFDDITMAAPWVNKGDRWMAVIHNIGADPSQAEWVSSESISCSASAARSMGHKIVDGRSARVAGVLRVRLVAIEAHEDYQSDEVGEQ